MEYPHWIPENVKNKGSFMEAAKKAADSGEDTFVFEENTYRIKLDEKARKSATLKAAKDAALSKWYDKAKEKMIHDAISKVKRAVELSGDRESAESIAFRIAKEYANLGISPRDLAREYKKVHESSKDGDDDTDTPLLVTFHDAKSKRAWMTQECLRRGDDAILHETVDALVLQGRKRESIEDSDLVASVSESMEVGTPSLVSKYKRGTPGEPMNANITGNAKDVIDAHKKATVIFDAKDRIDDTFANMTKGVK